METVIDLTRQGVNSYTNSILEDIESVREQIAELLDDGDDIRMNVDTYFAKSHELIRNTNHISYLAVSARTVGGELQVKIHNRNGTILAQNTSPHGCMLATVSLSTPEASTDTPMFGFNEETQNYFAVRPNGICQSEYLYYSGRGYNYYQLLMLLEIRTLEETEDWVQLGEFFVYINLRDDDTSMIATLHTPY